MTSFERAIDSPAIPLPSLCVAASPDQLRIVRGLVRVVAAEHAFAMDALADLVLAVDEAAGILVKHATPSTDLACAFDVIPRHSLQVRLSATTTTPINSSTSSFGWFVLQALVDEIAFEQVPPTSADGNWSVTITFDKGLQQGL